MASAGFRSADQQKSNEKQTAWVRCPALDPQLLNYRGGIDRRNYEWVNRRHSTQLTV
jgi:hypothetical protein